MIGFLLGFLEVWEGVDKGEAAGEGGGIGGGVDLGEAGGEVGVGHGGREKCITITQRRCAQGKAAKGGNTLKTMC